MIHIAAISQPPKGCQEIMVKGVTFKEAADMLLDSHFLIDKKDEILGTIKTERRDINYEKQKGGFIILTIRIKDSSAYINGNCGIDMTSFRQGILEYRIENRGMKGSVIKDAFNLMNEFALSFKRPVEYR